MDEDENREPARFDIQRAIEEAIRDFDFDNYGLDGIDPTSEHAEWVPDLARAVIETIAHRRVMGFEPSAEQDSEHTGGSRG